MKKNWKDIPLGIPMALASFGTIAALAANKRLHAGFGILWVGLSLWHGVQHCKKIKKDAQGLHGINFCSAPCASVSPSQRLLSTIRVEAYVEGRIRVRSTWFVDNPDLQKQVEAYVRSFTGVTKADINPLTGSLLIEYDGEQLRTKPGLAALEANIRSMAGMEASPSRRSRHKGE